MDKEKIKGLAKKVVFKHYPEMKSTGPKVKKIDTEIGESPFRKAGISKTPGRKIWVATFEKKETTDDGSPFKKFIRVSMDDRGNVLKITESK